MYYLVVLQQNGKSEVNIMGKSVGNLSLTEKVGQMFIIGLDGYAPDETVMELIQTYKVGGFIIDENNVQSVEQLLRLINALKSMNVGNEVPLIIATSQESGRENMLPSEIRKLPSIKYIADSADKNLVYEASNLTGRILKAFGFNMNLWPVLDLGGRVEGKELADRCISTNPTLVSSYSTQMVNGLNDTGIIAVPKYFPGHSTTKDRGSSIVIPFTNKSVFKLEQSDLIPFRSAIESGIPSMLVGHINLTKLNLFAPASMSYKVVTKLLKEKYKYSGVVISEDISSMCVDIQYGAKGCARRALLAGCDMIIMKDIKKVKGVLEDIAKQIKNGNLTSQEMDLRVQKILDMKDKFGLKDEEISEIEVKKINDEVEELIEKIRR